MELQGHLAAMARKRSAYRILVEKNLKGRVLLRDLGLNCRIILK
jgi:hypothetical protein